MLFEALEHALEMHETKSTISNNFVLHMVTFHHVVVHQSLFLALFFSWVFVHATDVGHAQYFHCVRSLNKSAEKRKKGKKSGARRMLKQMFEKNKSNSNKESSARAKTFIFQTSDRTVGNGESTARWG